MLNFQAKKGKSRRDQQLPVTEGPLIDLCDLEQRRAEAEETRPETDAERLAKLKVRQRTHCDTCHVHDSGHPGDSETGPAPDKHQARPGGHGSDQEQGGELQVSNARHKILSLRLRELGQTRKQIHGRTCMYLYLH